MIFDGGIICGVAQLVKQTLTTTDEKNGTSVSTDAI